MWKFSFITINAIVITEGNVYRRELEFYNQFKNEPTAKLKKWTPCVHIQANIYANTVLKNFNIPIPDNIYNYQI